MDSPGRRDPNQFEPPPWEKDQFEELSRRKAEAEALAAAEAKAAEAVIQPAAAEPIEPEQGERSSGDEPAAEASLGRSPRPDSVEIDESRVKEMMELLRVEEPAARSFWKVRLVVAALIAIAGAILMIWGIVGVRAASGNQTGVFGAMVLLIFGLGFIILAAWTAYSSLQQRGVI